MTLREFITKLQALPPEALDATVIGYGTSNQQYMDVLDSIKYDDDQSLDFPNGCVEITSTYD